MPAIDFVCIGSACERGFDYLSKLPRGDSLDERPLKSGRGLVLQGRLFNWEARTSRYKGPHVDSFGFRVADLRVLLARMKENELIRVPQGGIEKDLRG